MRVSTYIPTATNRSNYAIISAIGRVIDYPSSLLILSDGRDSSIEFGALS